MGKEILVKESNAERLSRLYRNWNILGALALGSLAIITPGSSPILAGLAGLNAAQAGGAELVRQHAKKSRLRKKLGGAS